MFAHGVLTEGVVRMNSDEVLDWIHFANPTSSAKWEYTLGLKNLFK